MKKWEKDLLRNQKIWRAHQKIFRVDSMSFRIKENLKQISQINLVKMKKIEFKKCDTIILTFIFVIFTYIK